MDGQNPAPPKKPRKDNSPRKYQQLLVSHGFNVVQDFVHPQYHLFDGSIQWSSHVKELLSNPRTMNLLGSTLGFYLSVEPAPGSLLGAAPWRKSPNRPKNISRENQQTWHMTFSREPRQEAFGGDTSSYLRFATQEREREGDGGRESEKLTCSRLLRCPCVRTMTQ